MDENFRLIWQHIADVIRGEVSADTYQRWFQAIELKQADEQTLHLQVPNQIYQLWIESNYLTLVQSAVLAVLGGPRELRFTLQAGAALAKAPTRAERSGAKPRPSAEKTLVPEPVVAPIEEVLFTEPAPPPVPEKVTTPAGMNSRNTFETFVVGANNQFAHAAALRVANAPAKNYNPFFMYGGVGLGKTHLMQAIGQYVHSQKKDAKVIYLSSEQFTNEFIDAIKNGALTKFRNRYRKADVLLIDDIQFFVRAERAQEEFFHTFNALFDGHKQIILSSDRPPAELAGLEQRLVSRFEQGLTAQLEQPDVETRVAILRKKAQTLHIKLADNVIQFLAQRIRSNIRRLEGALMRVASYSSLRGGELATADIENVLRDILQEEAKRVVTIDQIQKKVAEHYDIRIADMTSKRRPANIAFPRQIAMYLAREHTRASLTEIGEAFGGRDHGTVLHAHRLVQERMMKEEKTRQTLAFLDNQLTR